MSLLSRLAVEASRAYGFLTGSTTNISADFLVVAGGGGGGGAVNASPFYYQGSTGSSSSISGTGLTTITSIGGGYGGTYLLNASSGGSGGGGGASSSSAGSGTANQGYAGGAGKFATDYTGGGGGGAGAIGADATGSGATLKAGNGGAGVASSISGSSVTYAGGGGGAGSNTGGQGTGGSGGGGNGSKGSNGVAGTANLGGGGGGGDFGSGAGEGGGGGGGFRTSAGTSGGGASAESTISLSTLNTYSIVVGAGGNGGGTGATGTGGNGGSGIVIISYTSATPKFVGGTITTSGGKQIHTFTSSGTLSPLTPITANYLVVAGGGGGAQGGGGAGGLLTSSTTLYSGATYVVTVGAGGSGGPPTTTGSQTNGSDSILSGTGLTTITATGGGYGGRTGGGNGNTGGSGGGGAYATNGGAGTSGQGFAGGNGGGASSAGGGGGSSAVGSAGSGSTGGNGGAGTASSITGSSITYAGGGGGAANTTAGSGGTGGGGAGGVSTTNGGSGTTNLGGGGGGGGATSSTGGNGGSGIVIISYAGSQVFNGGLVTTSGGNTIHTFTSSGALTPLTNNLNNSLRFRSSASAYLNRTPTVASDRQKFTISFWMKRGAITGDYYLYNASTDANNSFTVYLNSSNNQSLDYFVKVAGVNYGITTSQVFRDPSAWYHIVLAVDTTQATAANRQKMYVNGNQVSNFVAASYVPQNTSLAVNNTVVQYICGPSSYFDGYLADYNFIDGQQLEPYYFGNNDANGVWKPILYKGTYGTNGFYLPFSSYSTNLISSYYGNFNSTGTTSTSTLLRINDSAVFNSGSSDFCWEVFFYATTSTSGTLFGKGGSVVYESIAVQYDGSTGITVYISNPSNVYIVGGTYTSSSLALNKWNHVAVYRSGSSWYIAINGNVQLMATSSNSVIDNSAPFIIGGISNATSAVGLPITGRISNLRYVVGSSVYGASNFTPPTTALTAISGTQLLTLQNLSIVDNSANALTITQVNASYPVTTALSPTVPDSSGNANNWLGNNIDVTSSTATTYDAMTDVPTNTSATVANFPVLNPLSNGGATISNANLTTTANGATHYITNSTFQMPTSGKYYWEITTTTLGSTARIATGLLPNGTALSGYPWGNANTYGWYYGDSSNNIYWCSNTTQPFFISGAVNDVLQICYDADNGTVYAGKNNVFYNSSGSTTGSPSTLTNPTSTGVTATNAYFPATSVFTAGAFAINFGQRPFSYTPPTGFVALNTYNLPTPTILQGNKYMDATLYTGNGSTQSITNAAGFKPDFVWVKARSAAYSNALYDSVRGTGTTKSLLSNDTASEGTYSIYTNLTSFNSNGFTAGTTSSTNILNENAVTFVGWQWQAGQGSTSSNTSGSITSTVSVNTTAGFSVVTYTGTGSAATVGHGLGVAPKMVIIKNRTASATAWNVYQASIPSGNLLSLNSTAASFASTNRITAVSSTTFSIGSDSDVNGSTNSHVAYCWAEIAGFSKFGSYTGNGNASGPFVYCGFQPKFIMFKRSDAIENWGIWTPLAGGNGITASNNFYILPNSSGAQDTTQIIDILSNGFKIRDSGSFDNANNGTYIYAAFASNPFKNSNSF